MSGEPIEVVVLKWRCPSCERWYGHRRFEENGPGLVCPGCQHVISMFDVVEKKKHIRKTNIMVESDTDAKSVKLRAYRHQLIDAKMCIVRIPHRDWYRVLDLSDSRMGALTECAAMRDSGTLTCVFLLQDFKIDEYEEKLGPVFADLCNRAMKEGYQYICLVGTL